jgi:galactokinase
MTAEKSNPEWIEALGPRFQAVMGRSDAPGVSVAPGRVNLIGEHTDYNDGWVLPMAIDRRVGVAFASRDDRVLRAHSVVYDATAEVSLDELAPPGGSEWIDYAAGVVWAMALAGHEVAGADLLVDGDVPLGSGLSSSAAIEMSVALAMCQVSGCSWSPVEMALLGQRVEREWIGVQGGVMDQYTATMGREGHALLLDCRSLTSSAVSFPEAAVVVVMDTGAPRTLAGSAYNERSASCSAAVEVLRSKDPEIRALRDIDLQRLENTRDRLDDTTYRRARHVVLENERPQAMADALAYGDLEAAGGLMNDSHFSLRDLYEVSSFELDLFTELAREHPACYGARLTGAGFGGCAIALVAAEGAEEFMAATHARYREQVDLESSIFACRPESGARLLEP